MVIFFIVHYYCLLLLLFLIGINIFLDGFVPTENLRFREESLTFKVSETADVSFDGNASIMVAIKCSVSFFFVFPGRRD